jgi:hypothetical protein
MAFGAAVAQTSLVLTQEAGPGQSSRFAADPLPQGEGCRLLRRAASAESDAAAGDAVGGTCRLGMSPACGPSGFNRPCLVESGSKWPRADLKSGGSHFADGVDMEGMDAKWDGGKIQADQNAARRVGERRLADLGALRILQRACLVCRDRRRGPRHRGSDEGSKHDPAAGHRDSPLPPNLPPNTTPEPLPPPTAR